MKYPSFGYPWILVGAIASKGWKPARMIGIGVCAFLTLIFSWRSTVSWMAVAEGNEEKLFAASLISTMLIASVVTIVLLLRNKPVSS